ncbi:MAG: PhzF family phenazine biosynthesis protein [Nocardioidaceae bacterium]
MRVSIVNACLRDGAGGSPTAVLEASQAEFELREVPRLAGTSHAVVVSVTGGGVDWPHVSLRFFTAAGELPACGHGTVAALAFLAENGRRHVYRVIVQASGRSFAGEVTREDDRVAASFDPGPVQIREATGEERALVLDAVGYDPGALLAEACVASLGRWPRLLVPVPTPKTLTRLQPDYGRLRDGCDRLGLLGCYLYSVPTTEGRLSARMFAPSIGVPEDIANANSTACLAAKLAQRTATRITADMGDSLGRPSTVTAIVRQTRSGTHVRVGGTARVMHTRRL